MIENFKLHVFRVVADTLSFSKAAEELPLSQPAVTSQVRSLEECLRIALFDRVGRNAIYLARGYINAGLAMPVMLGVLLGSLGGILHLRHPWIAAPAHGRFVSQSQSLRDVAVLPRKALKLDANSVMSLGILVLIATPILRVAFCIVGFARQKDRLYVVISTSVFAILIYSLIQGGR